MFKVQFPKLIQKKNINNNLLVRQLENGFIAECDLIEEHHDSIKLVNLKSKAIYLITTKTKNIDPQFEYVLKASNPFSISEITNGTVEMSWYAHPKFSKRYIPSTIVKSWYNSFTFKEEDLDKKIKGLRTPQIGSIYATLAHWKVTNDIGTVVLPTGTGKTETMLSLLIVSQCEKVLVIVPSDALREQIANKFVTLGLLKDEGFNIVNSKAKTPIVGIVNTKFKTDKECQDFFNRCNVIVSTIHNVSQSPDTQKILMSNLCSHLFIDEAHHVQARTWFDFRNYFEKRKRKILQFTATPYRNDRKKIDGKIVFTYPLKKAQEEGYFKKINFVSIEEWDETKADQIIADMAVKQLEKDLSEGKNHILMARCNNKARAKAIYKCYSKYPQYNPVEIHTGIELIKQRAIKQEILSNNGSIRIIICINMLGEGFDLPYLKIAAFHDLRKSLPVTLQLAGRFTRSKHDEELGEATFIANIADNKFSEELEELYSQDPDWNYLLPQINSKQIQKEIDFDEFIKGFKQHKDKLIPFQNIRTSLSTVVYKNKTKDWFPSNYKKSFEKNTYDYVYDYLNTDENVLIIITGQKKEIDWINYKEVYDINWELIIAYWDSGKDNLLYIHGTEKKDLYEKLAVALIGDKAELIKGIDVFRAFHNVKRVSLQNVGLKEYFGKDIRFRMSVGSDVESALTTAEKTKAEKAFVVGVGYENGTKVSVGCSYKGRMWTVLKGNIKEYIEWCQNIGKKLVDETIDANQILKETLIPELVDSRPNIYPICVDWNEIFYTTLESRYSFVIDDYAVPFFNCSLELVNPSEKGDLRFTIKTDNVDIEGQLKITFFKTNEGFSDYKIQKINPSQSIAIKTTRKEYLIEDFFYKNPPIIRFADGSSLEGSKYVQLKDMIKPYDREKIVSWDWTGVDLKVEAQGVFPKNTASIQYHVIEKLKQLDYDIIYDDDYSGEIADVITIKQQTDKIEVELYHLKYAKKGTVGKRVSDLYEVCGQAQKSVHWKHKEGKEFFDHLLRRETKKKNNDTCSRIEKGTNQDLKDLSKLAKKKLPVAYKIFIVQPGLSKKDASIEQLTLLSVVENYLKDVAMIDLEVIGSPTL